MELSFFVSSSAEASIDVAMHRVAQRSERERFIADFQAGAGGLLLMLPSLSRHSQVLSDSSWQVRFTRTLIAGVDIASSSFGQWLLGTVRVATCWGWLAGQRSCLR